MWIDLYGIKCGIDGESEALVIPVLTFTIAVLY